MIDEFCKLSDFGYGVTPTDMLKYIAEQTGLVYHKKTSLFLEHLYSGRSPTDYEILLVYDQGITYQLIFEHPVLEKLEEYRRDVSPNTVGDVINMIKAHTKNLKQATIDKKKKELEDDFID